MRLHLDTNKKTKVFYMRQGVNAYVTGKTITIDGTKYKAFDASPAWEDITAQVAINRVYNFLNQSKTAEKWGVNVRFTIEKNEGYEGEVSISGFGGAYE